MDMTDADVLNQHESVSRKKIVSALLGEPILAGIEPINLTRQY